MPNLLSFGLNILADVFYPKYCFGCKRAAGYLCKFCMDNINKLPLTFCVVCNRPSANGITHDSCRTAFTPDRLFSAFSYQNQTIADMIITAKYYFIPEVFAILGAMTADTLFADQIETLDLSNFVVCAIPLHTTRQRWRGFNQSEIASRIFCEGLNIPYCSLLRRIKNTQTQKNLNASLRKTNMANAFACSYQSPPNIILIDDVCTTGQTFMEATAALKQAGANIVWCVSIAKD